MKNWFAVVTMGLVGALVLSGPAVAENPAQSGQVRGIFVRLTEVVVGDGEYLGIVVKPQDADGHVTILVPREPKDVANVARKLRAGQKVEIAFVVDGGRRWLQGMEAVWRDAEGGKVETGSMVVQLQGGQRRVEIEHRRSEEKHDSDRRPERRSPDRALPRQGERIERDPLRGLAGQLKQLAGQIRQIAERLRRMENEMRQLRAENERLKRMLRQRDSRGEDRARRGSGRRRDRDVRRDVDRPRDGDIRRDRPDAQRRRGVRDGDGN